MSDVWHSASSSGSAKSGTATVNKVAPTGGLLKIQTDFDNDISVIENRFYKKIDAHVNLLCSRVAAVPANPITSTDVFDNAVSAFSAGIGDEKTGIYGDYVVDLNLVINKCSDDISNYVDANKLGVTTQAAADLLQGQISSLSDHITEVVTALNNRVSAKFESVNAKFSSTLSAAQTKASKFYIDSLTDSYIGAINRAESDAIKAVTTIRDLYNQYKYIPQGFYPDLSTILTDISNAYNDALNRANTIYNDSISAYKYFSDSASDDISSSQNEIGAIISDSTTRVGAILNSLPLDLTNKADYAFALATSSLGSKLFAETIRIRNNLDNFVSTIAKDSEITMRSIDKYFKSSYSPIFLDGASYRNSKSTTINGASELVSGAINSAVSKYNDYITVTNNNFNTFLNELNADVINFINERVPGLSDDQAEMINNRLSSIISSQANRLSSYFTYYSNYITYISNGLSSRLNTLAKRYYDAMPLLRFTGDVTTPVVISSLDYVVDADNTKSYQNVFRFGVQNIGATPWYGWFGIRLTSTTSDDDDDSTTDYDAPYFKWNVRVGYEFIRSGMSKTITIQIPGSRIKDIASLGSSVSPSVIINTLVGVYKSLL